VRPREPEIRQFTTRRHALDSRRLRELPPRWIRAVVHVREVHKDGELLGWVITYQVSGGPMECLGVRGSAPAVVPWLCDEKGWVLR